MWRFETLLKLDRGAKVKDEIYQIELFRMQT